MESLKELYRIGHGPSSSHTMGPVRAAEAFLKDNPNAQKYACELYGSLAATGKGHMTDKAIEDVFKASGKTAEVKWKPKVILPKHPNALKLIAFVDGKETASEVFYSVGGGRIIREHEDIESENIYPSDFLTMRSALLYCEEEGLGIWEIPIKVEGRSIVDYMDMVWKAMKDEIANGIEDDGVLPGGLKLKKKAGSYYIKSKSFAGTMGYNAELVSYALAASEQNAAGGVVVTAPTCGSCGVLPSVLHFLQKNYGFPDQKIRRALLTAGFFGNIIKENGSISGAEVGCQGEIGSACAMASAAATQLLGGSNSQIEYAAEMGLEHHLGLTCDPMLGLVQVPCIERNAMASMRAVNNAIYALMSDGHHIVSFDNAVEVMEETGKSLNADYKETADGGLARLPI